MFAPSPICVGELNNASGAFIVVEFLSLKPEIITISHVGLAQKVSAMHRYVSPNGKFGFPIQTMCRPQSDVSEDHWHKTWPESFKAMMDWMIQRLSNLFSQNWAKKVMEVAAPKLLDDLDDVQPVLLHTDLCMYIY